MVDSEGVGFADFTSETAISGTASISGNIVGISGDISISGSVSIVGNYTYRPNILVITSASGGQALGSGLTTSGYIVYNVIVKIPDAKVSGTDSIGFVLNSGATAPTVYIGGRSGDAPYPGNGFICSGKGLPLEPGEMQTFHVNALDMLYASAETSGNPLAYIVEMR